MPTGGERELRPVRSPTPSRKSRPTFWERSCEDVRERGTVGLATAGLVTAEGVEDDADAAADVESTSDLGAGDGEDAAGRLGAAAAARPVVATGVSVELLGAAVVSLAAPSAVGTARKVAALELETLPWPADGIAGGTSVSGVMDVKPLPKPLSLPLTLDAELGYRDGAAELGRVAGVSGDAMPIIGPPRAINA